MFRLVSFDPTIFKIFFKISPTAYVFCSSEPHTMGLNPANTITTTWQGSLLMAENCSDHYNYLAGFPPDG